jgi:hypothetical protein
MRKLILLFIIPAYLQSSGQEYDVCVYGGTSAGVIAAYTVARAHKKVILIEPGKHLGGLSSGGLGYTDIGNKYVITGLARDFYRRTGQHYRKFETWIFEPHVAEDIFNQYIKEARVPVLFQYRIAQAHKPKDMIHDIVLERSDGMQPKAATIIRAKMFIDCSYEGDLMAKAGVSYAVGREDNSLYNETWNGVELLDKHQFPDDIDPYKIPGDSTSNLLWGISNNKLLPNGTGNKMVQTYNFRLCLTDDAANRIDIAKPEGYDPAMYELLLRVQAKRPSADLNDALMKIDLMPNHKTDINNNGPFSTDMIGMNYDYPDGDYDRRKRILNSQEQYVKGFLYFIGHDERMPRHLREEMLKWGYPKDEYRDNDHFSPQAYIRESRRMIGEYVMTQANCEGRVTVKDVAGMAAYTMDSHNCERLVVNNRVKNEGDVQIGGFGPYPVSYRSLVPKTRECKNLLVPVCLSASHIAYGSIRMEPVFMVLAQSAAVASCIAIDGKQGVQQVSMQTLHSRLSQNPLMNGSIPEILVDDNDSLHTTITGSWSRQSQHGYGPSWLCTEGKGNAQQVQFTPEIKQAGRYEVYTYLPSAEKASTHIIYKINTGRFTKEVVVSSSVNVEGQTSGEWISLGRYDFAKGKKAAVTVTTKGADGRIVADAILWVPVNPLLKKKGNL